MIVEAKVERFSFSETRTISRLILPGVKTLLGLEDRIRAPGIKVPKQTAIECGRFRVVVDFSKRFQRDLPHVLDVPRFVGIRWHSGNTHEDTEGCLLVGKSWVGDQVHQSRNAMGLVMEWFKAHEEDEVWVTYTNLNPPKHLLEAA